MHLMLGITNDADADADADDYSIITPLQATVH